MPEILLVDEESRKIRLPQWLDKFIYSDLNGIYAPCREEMHVLEWQADRMNIYVGTYFPRSFSEAYCIFKKYLYAHNERYAKQNINILDLGCGTGGELLGLLCSLRENLPAVQNINITAIDGNKAGLRILEKIISRFQEFYQIDLICKFGLLRIDDVKDLQTVTENLKHEFDIALSFKAIGELVSQFYPLNPYEYFINSLLKTLTGNGISCIADVANFNTEQSDWLPNILDTACIKLNSKTLYMNAGNVDIFKISHSQKDNDVSKIAWRIIEGQ